MNAKMIAKIWLTGIIIFGSGIGMVFLALNASSSVVARNILLVILFFVASFGFGLWFWKDEL